MKATKNLWLKSVALLMLTAGVAHGQTEVIVTPANPQGWTIVNQRADSTVEVTASQPRAGTGSLEFVTNFATAGQDKVDYQLDWDPTIETNRTLANLTELAYEYYRDSAGSAVPAHLHPVLRLAWYHDGGTPGNVLDDSLGTMVYEEIYQGVNPVPGDTWDSNVIDFANDNLWVYCSNCGGNSGVVQNFNSTIQDWLSGPITGQGGDPVPPDFSQGNTFIWAVNMGVGSGCSNDLLMWTDQVRIAFGPQDDLIYNFEMDAPPMAPAVPVPSMSLAGMTILFLSLLFVFAYFQRRMV